MNFFKKIRLNPGINKIIRSFIKKASHHSAIGKALVKKWPVSGIIQMCYDEYHYRLYAQCDDHIINSLYYNPAYESNELELIAVLSPKIKVMIDVGANTGIYSIFSLTVNPDLKVHAFEPHPTNYQRLIKNISLNRYTNIIAMPLAVSNYFGEIDFYIPEDEAISDVSSTSKAFSEGIYHTEFKKIIVSAVTLDEYVHKAGINRIDFLKIDVEGFELEALQGAMNTLKNNDLLVLCEIFCEYCLDESLFSKRNPKPYQIESIMKSLGYYIYAIGKGKLYYLETLNYPDVGRNYLFSKKKFEEKTITFCAFSNAIVD